MIENRVLCRFKIELPLDYSHFKLTFMDNILKQFFIIVSYLIMAILPRCLVGGPIT